MAILGWDKMAIVAACGEVEEVKDGEYGHWNDSAEIMRFDGSFNSGD